jgi:hypothetical protein
MVNDDGDYPNWQELEKAKVFTILEASEQLHSLSEKCVIREIEEETVEEVKFEPIEGDVVIFDADDETYLGFDPSDPSWTTLKENAFIFNRTEYKAGRLVKKTTTKRKVVE